jgi:hypothetical protein
MDWQLEPGSGWVVQWVEQAQLDLPLALPLERKQKA